MYDLLKGVRVLDLSSVVLGPFATLYLGDFGADVIKVEPLTGDIFRHVRPARSDNMGAGYLNLNRNKRCVSLDLKQQDDMVLFKKLLDEADVLVHNMRPSAAKRLGIEPKTIRSEYPKLVYCATPGFGSGGRLAENPAYDDIIQAACGFADLNKGPEGEPRFAPTIICDKVSGMHMAIAVLAGITHQARTGEGCFIEAPMFEGMVSFLMAEQLAGETFRPAKGTTGYKRLLSPNRRPHKTKDGYIGVLPYNSKHWTRFLAFIESDLAKEDWVQSAAQRSIHIDELYAELSAAMISRTTEDWLGVLTELDIPCTPVNSLDDLLTNDHLKDVELFSDIEHPTEGALRSVQSPFWIDGAEQKPDMPAPELNTDDKTLTWLER